MTWRCKSPLIGTTSWSAKGTVPIWQQQPRPYGLRTEFPPSIIPWINVATAACSAALSRSGWPLSCAAAASLSIPRISDSGRIFRSFRASNSDSHIAKAAVPDTSLRWAIVVCLSNIGTSDSHDGGVKHIQIQLGRNKAEQTDRDQFLCGLSSPKALQSVNQT